jgi:hypothetical protein
MARPVCIERKGSITLTLVLERSKKKTTYLEKRIGIQLRNNGLKSGSGTVRNGYFAKAQAHEAGS